MGTRIALCVAAAAIAASPVLAQTAANSAPSHKKSKEQIQCELFGDTAEGKAACGATRAWITKTGVTITDRAKIKAEQALTTRRPREHDRDSAPGLAMVKSSDLYINFDPGSSTISDDAFDQAKLLYEAVTGVGKGWRQYRFEVAGHTDTVGGTPSYNMALSVKRAEAVADLLVARGVDRALLTVKGYGFTRPLDGIEPTSGMNRRVEIKRLN